MVTATTEPLQVPVVRGGAGYRSRVHLDDAASATWPARPPAGQVAVTTAGRGFSATKAEREPRHPSWRQGRKEEPA
ncbi:hypothetical protein [Nonomuraea sp. bgisy101]|uniref:hypothetical protein n=1 Tax=Nonomuraea sp. bgisy101 TaxID=3413784 RepID=UPI003D711AF2